MFCEGWLLVPPRPRPEDTNSGTGKAVLSFFANSTVGQALIDFATGHADSRQGEQRLQDELSTFTEQITALSNSSSSLFTKGQVKVAVGILDGLKKLKGDKGAPPAFVKLVDGALVKLHEAMASRIKSSSVKLLTEVIKALSFIFVLPPCERLSTQGFEVSVLSR